jgi:3-methyladenine DNA glycosylase AlkD
MTAEEIVRELEPMGAESYRKVMRNHGAQDPLFGVKISDMKPIQKRIKKAYELALELYATGVYDAQYLAGLVADESKMTEEDLRRWLATANCGAISGTSVAWVAAESRHGQALALEWIESPDERTADAGWHTLSSLVAVKEDAELDPALLTELLQRVGRTLHQQPNRVRAAMNGFVIAAGTYVSGLTALAMEIGEQLGPVSVDMGNTACQVPFAPDYLRKVQARGTVGKKRKTARC